MTPLLEARGLTKTYPGTTALRDVSFDLLPGEVHCLIGENGAGKSTLIKILAGAVTQDSGEIAIAGRPVGHHVGVRERRDLGISVIYQDLNLVPQLTVAENIFLGHEPRTRLGSVDTRAMRALAQELIATLGVSFPVTERVGDLPIPLQQLTATARALSLNGKVLIMDEPSTVLGGRDLDVLFEVVRRLRRRGIGIVYISHHLDEVFALGDRVTVLRDGQFVATRQVGEIDKDDLIRMMVGRSLGELNRPMGGRRVGAEVLRVEHLTSPRLRDISFTLHRGEVLGIAGLVGAGRTELARAIVGLDRFDSGTIALGGEARRIRGPHQAVALGISLVPEDRKAEGLVSVLSIRANAALSILDRMTRLGFLRLAALRQRTDGLAKRMAIKAPRLDMLVSGLSGGNQQKVVLAKCLATGCQVLILDEPTRGVDVGAKVEIYRLIEELVAEGLAILLISSELPEILSLSDRVLVMSQGRVTAELDARAATQEDLMRHAVPGAAERAAS